ncbi:MAG: iron-sulfur cluster assembly protein [Proteobacteria bacterium]|nr:iron-sulfur cluster assembly protein [Pseudomonadota bacterium]
MYGRESIVLQRDVNVVQIPDGTPSVLPKGHVVTLFQSLGGNYTVTNERGHMVRVAGEDADALGKEPPCMSHLETGEEAEAVEKNAWEVDIIMTLTAPGCGMGPVLQQDVEAGIKGLPGVAKVNVEVVFDPPWSRDMMSEVAKLQLGMF